MTRSFRGGFTIVELLIVVVIIAILAAITVVAYNGIQNRARQSAMSNMLNQYAKKIELYKAENGQYPNTLSDAGLASSNGATFQYSTDNIAGNYCITANGNAATYYISNATGSTQQGTCTGQSLLVWDKTNSATMPIPSATFDSGVYRVSLGSMRLGPNSTGRMILGNPYGGGSGQTFTVTFWMITDATWNGTVNNSKIRFGDGGSNALLNACGINGVKATWTQVSCGYTTTTTNPTVGISVGNDGTVGNIWIDDFMLTRT